MMEASSEKQSHSFVFAGSRVQSFWTVVVVVALVVLDVIWYHQKHYTPSNTEQNDLVDSSPQQPPRRRLLGLSSFLSDTVVEFDKEDPHLALFQLSDYTVLGPSQFPTPTQFIQTKLQAPLEGQKGAPRIEVTPLLQPTLGQHRADQDAVFVFASEYELSIYQGFILSLRKTGYQGDIVLAVSPLDMAAKGAKPTTTRQEQVQEFFASDPHVIIYVVPFVCFNAEGEAVDSAKGGIRVCQCHVLYGSRNVTVADPKDKKAHDVIGPWQALDDFRVARPVATTRYELYWIWSLQYNKHSWIMLVDARDTYFQTDPFAAVPREPNLERNSGVIFFFGVRRKEEEEEALCAIHVDQGYLTLCACFVPVFFYRKILMLQGLANRIRIVNG
jgi:hypothetical protein